VYFVQLGVYGFMSFVTRKLSGVSLCVFDTPLHSHKKRDITGEDRGKFCETPQQRAANIEPYPIKNGGICSHYRK
jgi:hypothetical protein